MGWGNANVTALHMSDAKTSPASPTSSSNNVRQPLKCSPQNSSFKRRSSPAGSHLKATIPRDIEATHLDMAASFLQYCAMCEKQILTPSNAILYCSEACRRKDSCKPLSLAAVSMASPTNTPPSSGSSSPHSILPPRTPTGTTSAAIGIPAGLHNAKADLDPTEWKPRLLTRSNSEAFRYLSQFRREPTAAGGGVNDEGGGHRHLFSHCSTTSIASMTTPSLSLSQTPSTASSSLSTGAEYDFNTRPLQSRRNPMYSASAGTTKSIDLVLPFVAPSAAASLPCQFDDSKYEKRPLAKISNWPAEGLGALIGRKGQM
jgi:hypothetical protein